VRRRGVRIGAGRYGARIPSGTADGLALKPAQPPAIVNRCVFQGPMREVSISPSSSAKVENMWSYACLPPIRLHGVDFVLNASLLYHCRLVRKAES
jgi:hypothetical protein